MDLIVYIIIGIVMAVVTWLASKFLGYKAGQAIATIAALAVVLPLLIIAAFGMLGMLYSEPEAVQEIAASTIDRLINYVGNNLPYVVASDVGGIIAGAVIGLFTGRER